MCPHFGPTLRYLHFIVIAIHVILHRRTRHVIGAEAFKVRMVYGRKSRSSMVDSVRLKAMM